mmetsp:Transcript_4394/g.13927  ORF Transcript_4394/g.13927 Transcript_4394/m.13927 type:complete len:205 (-) Transcript_4394:202-816(-)
MPAACVEGAAPRVWKRHRANDGRLRARAELRPRGPPAHHGRRARSGHPRRPEAIRPAGPLPPHLRAPRLRERDVGTAAEGLRPDTPRPPRRRQAHRRRGPSLTPGQMPPLRARGRRPHVRLRARAGAHERGPLAREVHVRRPEPAAADRRRSAALRRRGAFSLSSQRLRAADRHDVAAGLQSGPLEATARRPRRREAGLRGKKV